MTVPQLSYWRNSESLFEHATRVTSGNYVAEHNLGLAFAEEGRLPEAIAHYRAALAIRPDSVEAHSDLGTAFSNLGQLEQAAAEYRAALQLAPDSAIPHNNLGNTYFRLGKLDAAITNTRPPFDSSPITRKRITIWGRHWRVQEECKTQPTSSVSPSASIAITRKRAQTSILH